MSTDTCIAVASSEVFWSVLEAFLHIGWHTPGFCGNPHPSMWVQFFVGADAGGPGIPQAVLGGARGRSSFTLGS